MTSSHARFRLLPTVLLVSSLITSSLLAQDAGNPPPPPSGGAGGPGMGGPGGGRGMAADPTLVDGPMLPEEFAATANLDAKQESRYASLYQNLMASTKADRAALRDARDKMRLARQQGSGAAGGGGNQEQMRASREKLRPAMENLRKGQDAFDASLKEFLKPDQLKAYDDWRETKREEARAQFGGGQGRRP